jgi:diguanylate cyclase (GGDEF)-like protein
MLSPPARLARFLIRCALLLAGALGVGAATAASRWIDPADTPFQHLTRESGLPHEIANAVSEDGAGFLWVGTYGGLVRWDGYRFRTYLADRLTPGALPDSYVRALHRDPTGTLWIGTGSAGLVRYDRATDRFVTYPVGPQGLSHVNVRAIVDDGAQGLWVATDAGLDHVDCVTGRIVQAAATLGLAGLAPNSLLRDSQGNLWAGTPAGLFRRGAAQAGFTPFPLPSSRGEVVRTVSLSQDEAGRIWVGSREHGVFVIASPSPGAPVRHLDELSSLREQTARLMVEAKPGEMWLGMEDRSIVTVDLDRGVLRRIRNVPGWPASLPEAALHDLYRDRAGLIWVATDKGVSRVDPRQTAITTRFGTPGAGRAERTGTEVSWILPMPGERVWLGTHQSGVEIIDADGVSLATLRPDPSRPEQALPDSMVLAMERAADGSVFVATRRGLYRASADGRHVARVHLAGRDPALAVWALRADGDTLWIGGQDDGLWRMDLRSGLAEPWLREPGQGLSDERIVVMTFGPDGLLWVGTRNGLNVVDRQRAAVVARYLPGPAAERGLVAGFVTSLHWDRHQRLWVGTLGGGVDLLPLDDQKAPTIRLGMAQDLPDYNVNAMLEDSQHRVWVSTDNGLAVIEPSTLSVRSMRRADGVVFATYWTGAAARTERGELLFGAAGGMTIVRPDEVRPWTYRPRVVVSDLQVGGRDVLAPARLSSGDAAVVVPPEANSLVVEFSAIDFSAPERNRYAYKLEGFDQDWVDTDASRRLAAYTNLPPGRYQLLLRGSNREGVWSEQALALPVRVMPAWHQTMWFRAVAALAALALVVAIVQARTRLLRSRQAELERKVLERTVELETLHRALKDKSLVLELSSITDPLTGLHNRRFLTEHIDHDISASLRRAQEMRAAGGVPADTDSVFYLVDADHFKRVNDLHGHAAGDAVLVEFSRRLRSVLRESDHLVRWGGEEFLAVARDTDRERAEELAERIRSVIAETPFLLDDGSLLPITCSIGFACLPYLLRRPHALNWQDIVRLADLGLLTAKRTGRDCWVGLHATETARPESLQASAPAAPLQALQQGEMRASSNRPLPEVVQALMPADGR